MSFDRLVSRPPALDLITAIGSQDSYLAVVNTLRSDGTPHSSLVNAAVVAHPVTGAQVGAFVTYGRVKLAHLRRRPALTVTWRSGWSWVSLDGTAQLAGPHDQLPGLDPTTSRACSGPSSPPRADSTPTGTPMTASWPNRAVSPSSSTQPGPTPTLTELLGPCPRLPGQPDEPVRSSRTPRPSGFHRRHSPRSFRRRRIGRPFLYTPHNHGPGRRRSRLGSRSSAAEQARRKRTAGPDSPLETRPSCSGGSSQ